MPSKALKIKKISGKINWGKYHKALKERGNLLLWINLRVIKKWLEERRTRFAPPSHWRACAPPTKRKAKRGRPRFYSNLAIRSLPTLGQLLHQPLRQTEGFLCSIFQLLNLPIPVPSYTTLCRRRKRLRLPLPKRKQKVVAVAVDTT